MMKAAMLLGLFCLGTGLELNGHRTLKRAGYDKEEDTLQSFDYAWRRQTRNIFKTKTEDSPDHPVELAGQHEDTWNPQIDIYVVNLARRTDRCTCMKNQLNHLPANIYRHLASEGADCKVDKFEGGGHNWNAETSLFCSNRKIWERAQNSTADFVIIMEDDSALSEGWFEKVHELTKCKEFNYLNVDTVGEGAWERRDYTEEKCSNAGFMKQDGWGSQMQIIRKSWLPTLISKAEEYQGAMDVKFIYFSLTDQNDGAFRWMPGIVSQFHNDPKGLEGAEGCSGGWNGDIQTFARWPVSKQKKLDRMEC